MSQVGPGSRGSQRDSTRTRQIVRRCLFVCGGAVFGMCSVSCNNGLSDVDAKVQRILSQRSDAVGGDPLVPNPALPSPNQKRTAAESDKAPPTVNPDAEKLRFVPAAESRDLEERLRTYAREAQGVGSEAQVRKLSLEDALKQGQLTASEFLSAEEDYMTAAIRTLVERHLWGPRFFNDTTATIEGSGNGGSFQHAAQVINNLRVAQRLPYGGAIEAGWVYQATENLRESATEEYTQSSQLTMAANIPLLRGAGLVAQEGLIQSERSLVYQARSFESFRRDFLVSISADYFNLLELRKQIVNTQLRLENLQWIERAEAARYAAGRIAEFRKSIATNDVLQATQSLANQSERYILALDRFKIRLGLNPTEVLELDDALPIIPEPGFTLDEATRLALEYRLDLQNRRDQVEDARRQVANAKNELLPDLNVTGSAGLPTDNRRRVGGLAFDPDYSSYRASATFGLPLDREIERLNLRQATIVLNQQEREYLKFRDEVAVGVREALRNIDLARFELRLAEERVKINERRVQELKIKSAEVDTQTQVDATNNLQESLDSLERSRTGLRNAILNFLRDSGLLRISRDGTLRPLPGMNITAPPPTLPVAPVVPAPAPEPTGPEAAPGAPVPAPGDQPRP